MNETRRCLYCQSSFLPSRHRPQQRVCSRPDCQRQRRTNSRRQKLATDVEYRQVVRDSQKQWWDEHPGYQKVDLETKRKAIARVKPVAHQSQTPWSKNPTILDWLESL